MFITYGPPNNPPYPPVIIGPDIVQINKNYSYTLQSNDPDEDDIRYIVTWGDGTEDISDYQTSNTPALFNHTWITIIPIMILKMTATAEDEFGAKSLTSEKWIIIVWFKSLSTIYSVVTKNMNYIQSNQNIQRNNHQILSNTLNRITNRIHILKS
jgi:hypothetical protein